MPTHETGLTSPSERPRRIFWAEESAEVTALEFRDRHRQPGITKPAACRERRPGRSELTGWRAAEEQKDNAGTSVLADCVGNGCLPGMQTIAEGRAAAQAAA